MSESHFSTSGWELVTLNPPNQGPVIGVRTAGNTIQDGYSCPDGQKQQDVSSGGGTAVSCGEFGSSAGGGGGGGTVVSCENTKGMTVAEKTMYKLAVNSMSKCSQER